MPFSKNRNAATSIEQKCSTVFEEHAHLLAPDMNRAKHYESVIQFEKRFRHGGGDDGTVREALQVREREKLEAKMHEKSFCKKARIEKMKS